eukprot:30543-Pelagococcus_subviridis.AAC.1
MSQRTSDVPTTCTLKLEQLVILYMNALVTSTHVEDKRSKIPSSSALLVNVSVGTIDENIRHLRPDVIKTDTEGFDSAVLEGGKKTLCTKHTEQTVPVVLFEKHKLNLWSESEKRLHGIVTWLDTCGYNCYVVGPRLETAKISQGCWHDVWEALTWSNFICAHRVSAERLVSEYDGWAVMDKP